MLKESVVSSLDIIQLLDEGVRMRNAGIAREMVFVGVVFSIMGKSSIARNVMGPESWPPVIPAISKHLIYQYIEIPRNSGTT